MAKYKYVAIVLVAFAITVLMAVLLCGCTRKVHTSKSESSQQTTVITSQKDSSKVLTVQKEILTTYFGDTLRGNVQLPPVNLGGGSNTVASPVRLPVEDSLESNGIKIKVRAAPQADGSYKLGITGIAKPIKTESSKEASKDSSGQKESNFLADQKAATQQIDKTTETRSYWQLALIAGGLLLLLIVFEIIYQNSKKTV